MSRLPTIQTESATGKAKELLEAVQTKLKITPNMTRVMANSPAVLQAYLNFSGALASGVLNPKLREQIAIAVAEQNTCQYCLSAHTALGKMAGLTDAELASAREASSSSAKNAAALKFAHQLVSTQGRPTDADFHAVRSAGFSDAEIAEIIAPVSLNIFANYFNNNTQAEADFPKIALRKSA